MLGQVGSRPRATAWPGLGHPSPAHDDLVAREIDVLHPHARGLEETKARSVEQERHQPVNAAELTDDGAEFVTGQHHGQAGGPLGTDDVVEPRQLLREHLAAEKSSALSAWLCVDPATWPSTASEVKNRVTSGPPISRAAAGCWGVSGGASRTSRLPGGVAE